ncbi:MAG TPA: hypothetical protein VJ797_15660 [Burkholderiales bacterium]|nr:hypothetical protein [Burkholderiales bacterium]
MIARVLDWLVCTSPCLWLVRVLAMIQRRHTLMMLKGFGLSDAEAKSMLD